MSRPAAAAGTLPPAPPASPLPALLLALLLLPVLAGCAGGHDLLAEDQARAAADGDQLVVVRPTESRPTTRQADLEAAPVVTLTISAKAFVPRALTLPAGLVRFRVENRDERPTYFWLRRAAPAPGADEPETIILASVPDQGSNDAYAQLEPGEYVFSAPMPPDAPTFRLTVE